MPGMWLVGLRRYAGPDKLRLNKLWTDGLRGLRLGIIGPTMSPQPLQPTELSWKPETTKEPVRIVS